MNACHEIGYQLAAVGSKARTEKSKEVPDEKRFKAGISYSQYAY